MGALGLLGALTSALPREHRAAISRRAGGGPRFAQPPVSVHEKAAGDFWQPNVEERECVDLVPEDVTSVGLPVQPAGRQSGVKISGMHGAHLQHVGDVQPQQLLHAFVSGHPHVANLPELIPGGTMSLVRSGKVGMANRRGRCFHQCVADRWVARDVEAHHLLDPCWYTWLHVEGQDLLDVVLHLVERSSDWQLLLVTKYPRSSSFADVEV